MRYFLLFILLVTTPAAFAQKAKSLEYTITKDNTQIIKLLLPAGTVINSGGKVTIGKWQIQIETTPIESYINKNFTGEKRNIGILTNFSMKDMKKPESYEEQHTIQSKFRVTDKGNCIMFMKNTYINEENPEKMTGATVAGNYILSLTIINDTSDAEQAGKQLTDILDTIIITQDGQPITAPE